MNSLSNKKGQDPYNQIPGCLGGMINIFELSVAVSGPKLLTEKAHRDCSPVRRGQPKVARRSSNPIESQIDSNQVSQELRRSSPNKTSNGMPVKMLIAQEMSTEMETGRKPPNVVARLMGLDALPAQRLNPNVQRAVPEGCAHNCCTVGEAIQGCQQLLNNSTQRMFPLNIRPLYSHNNEAKEYKDVYEVWQKPSRTNHSRTRSLSGERCSENSNENRIALVRQKFMEAKRLSTNQKLLDSKEFQDALEVLSSNRDLFLKFLEEPNSHVSKHLQGLQTTAWSTQARCITVLKPSKMPGTESEQKLNKDHLEAEPCELAKMDPSWSGLFHAKAECLSQPTRIVVLKPSPGNARAVVHSPALSQRLCEGEDSFAALQTDEARASREVAKEITRQLRESLSRNRRVETLLSSVLSNGYNGDESSVNEFMEEEYYNFSDTQIVTPSSRYSWDYLNRTDSPYSVSSVSRASCSPESSVIMEAKKRLSERLAMVTSSGMNSEKRPIRRKSSTLGEMLAAPDRKKKQGKDEAIVVPSRRSPGGEDDLKMVSSCLSNVGSLDENSRNSSFNVLQRSKSVPSSSSLYGNIEVNPQVSNSQLNSSIVSKQLSKPKSVKSSLKGKVSSFFSRNKKSSPEKMVSEVPGCFGYDVTNRSDSPSVSVADFRSEDEIADVVEVVKQSHCFNLDHGCYEQETPPPKEVFSLEKSRASHNNSESLEQPSPVSVLEALFEEDTTTCSSLSCEGEGSGSVVECHRVVSRSPLIESSTRSLSWEEDVYIEQISSNHHRSPSYQLKTGMEEREQEHVTIIQMLLSSSGLKSNAPGRFLDGWHSLESPLNPSLLDKFLDPKEEGAKCRERRSNQRLMFDCVNAALLEISRCDRFEIRSWSVKISLRTCNSTTKLLADEVMWRIKEWCVESENLVYGYSENSSPWVEFIIRKDVSGLQWEEMMSLEIAEMSKEIEEQVLEELVGEALDGFLVSWLQ